MIEIGERWTNIAGSVYGLQQPSMTGVIRTQDSPIWLINTIVQTMDELLETGNSTATPFTRNELINKVPVWASRIQNSSRIPTANQYHISQNKQDTEHQSFWITFPTANPEATRITLQWIAATVNLPYEEPHIGQTKTDMKASLQELKSALQPYASTGLNIYQILESAFRLDIPVRKIASASYMLGMGAQSRWMESTITDRTPFLGAMAAQDKQATARLLQQAGLPGGTNQLVHSAGEAVQVAHSIGFPVVVKPTDKEQGSGVMADLRDEAIVRTAYHAAKKVSNNILVERHVKGFTHRLTVIHGKVARVTKRIAGGIVGDGIHDIGQLISLLQQDPSYQRRVESMGKQLISLDNEALSLLKQYGLKPSHVPAAGEYLKLRRRDNVNAGATNQTCDLSTVHVDNLQLAIDAAALLRLDLAGIDLIIENIEQSWREVDAVICEINARPQIVAPEDPFFYDGILQEIIGKQSRIPLHLVIVPENPDLRRELVRKWVQLAPGNTLSDATGLWIGGLPASRCFSNGFQAAMALLSRPNVLAAVCLLTPEEIRRNGLPANQWASVCVEKRALFSSQELIKLKPTLSLLPAGTQVKLLQDPQHT